MRRFSAVWQVCAAMLATCLAPTWATADMLDGHAPQIDSVMYVDPTLTPPGVRLSIRPELKAMWLEALARPEADLQRLAADTFALASQRGMRDLNDVHAPLVERLIDADSDPDVRRAAAHALVVLDARDRAPELAAAADGGGLALAQVIEPAMAAWDYAPFRQRWLGRLQAVGGVQPELLSLAIDGLATVGETSAIGALTTLALEPRQPAHVRLAAARAAARLDSTGLADEARQLADDGPTHGLLGRILAAELLAAHDDADSVALLLELAADDEPAVAGNALRRLFEIDPLLVRPLAAAAVANRDVNVRRVGVSSLVEQATPESVSQLALLLDDVNPSLRRRVAGSLVGLAGEDALRPTVIEESTQMLATDRWRGLEQATVVLIHLDHKPAGARLVELLGHPRPEVAIAAAWGLRRLELPEHLPAMLAHAQHLHQQFTQAGHVVTTGEIRQASQLFQAFGTMRFADADALLRLFVPKNFGLGEESRAAAVWALGYLYEDAAPEDLIRAFDSRLSDTSSPTPESGEVRRMAAVSLGRINAEAALPTLKRFQQEEGPSHVGLACSWSVERITGEPQPEYSDFLLPLMDWFIAPAQ